MTTDKNASSNAVQEIMEQAAKGPVVPEGYDRSFYTLWGKESESRIWENAPQEDMFGSLMDGTGRQDWRKLRPFDLLPDIDPKVGGHVAKTFMVGEETRVGCEAIVGTQDYFERAGDFHTIWLQFSGTAFIETSFGNYELHPGQAMLMPAMVANRTTGSANCRRMVYTTKNKLEPNLDDALAVTDIRYTVHRVGEPAVDEDVPTPDVPADGKVVEHLTHWDSKPGDDYLIKRTYSAMVGQSETGQGPAICRPFDFYSTPPEGPTAAAVRTSLLWENDIFRQRTYSNPARQPGTHRGYDEDEYWFQFGGLVSQETEHAVYPMTSGEVSMAEAGISHNSVTQPGSLRLTTYTSKPIRMVVDPEKDHLRHTEWKVDANIVRGWPEKYEGPKIPGATH